MMNNLLTVTLLKIHNININLINVRPYYFKTPFNSKGTKMDQKLCIYYVIQFSETPLLINGTFHLTTEIGFYQ